MDAFTEKIVAKRKTATDRLVVWLLIISGIILALIVLSIRVLATFVPFLLAGIVFGVYYLSKSKNIEFEYSYTNGDLDIDVIIARRKRKRIFSGSCKEFDIVARYGGDKYNEYNRGIQKTIAAVSTIYAEDVYFAVTNNKGQKVMILFEPGMKMLELMKTFIPKKVLID